MSEAPEAAASAARAVQASPTVPESPFDLIALERTRMALQVLGVGFLLRALAMVVWFVLPAGLLSFSSSFLLIVATVMSATTPHGPFTRGLRTFYVCVWSLDCACAIALMAELIRREFSTDFNFPIEVGFAVMLVGLATLALPVFLWRFCHRRELKQTARLWLWLALASPAPWILLYFGANWFPGLATPKLEDWLVGASLIASAVLHLCTFALARHTASAIWLDALDRHARVFAHANPEVAVVPLHPADRH